MRSTPGLLEQPDQVILTVVFKFLYLLIIFCTGEYLISKSFKMFLEFLPDLLIMWVS